MYTSQAIWRQYKFSISMASLKASYKAQKKELFCKSHQIFDRFCITLIETIPL